MITKQQRTIVISAIAVTALIVLWFVVRGGSYYVNADFQTGGQLVKGANVSSAAWRSARSNQSR